MRFKLAQIWRTKVELVVALYDGWVGYYWDKSNNALYLFTLPWVGVRISRPRWRYRG
jgi:hypothetical protein